jgi:hypothetical protein
VVVVDAAAAAYAVAADIHIGLERRKADCMDYYYYYGSWAVSVVVGGFAVVMVVAAEDYQCRHQHLQHPILAGFENSSRRKTVVELVSSSVYDSLVLGVTY